MKEKVTLIDKRTWSGMVDTFSKHKHCLHLLIAILNKVNPKNDDNAQLHDITLDLSHLKIQMGLFGNDTTKNLRDAVMTIMSTPIEFETDTYWTARTFLSAPRIEHETRLVTVDIDPFFKPFLTQLQDFLEIKERILGAKNRSLLFYTKLKSIHRQNVWKVTPEDLQDACNVSYAKYSEFKRKFLQPVLNDLRDNNIIVNYKEHYAGRRVDYLSFYMSEPKQLPSTPETTAERPIIEDSDEPEFEMPTPPPKKGDASGSKVLETFDYFCKAVNLPQDLYKLTNQRKVTIGQAITGLPIDTVKSLIDCYAKDPWYQERNILNIETIFKSPEKFQNKLGEVQKSTKKVASREDIKKKQEESMAKIMAMINNDN